jgi:hypothetical protein
MKINEHSNHKTIHLQKPTTEINIYGNFIIKNCKQDKKDKIHITITPEQTKNEIIIHRHKY